MLNEYFPTLIIIDHLFDFNAFPVDFSYVSKLKNQTLTVGLPLDIS